MFLPFQNPILCCFSLLFLVTLMFSKTTEPFSLKDHCVLLYFVVKVNGDHESTRHLGYNILCIMERNGSFVSGPEHI